MQLSLYHLHLVLSSRSAHQCSSFGRRDPNRRRKFLKFFAVISDTATAALMRWANNAQEANPGSNRQRFFHWTTTGTRLRSSDRFFFAVKTAAVFGFINRIGGGTNLSDARLFQHALTLSSAQFSRLLHSLAAPRRALNTK